MILLVIAILLTIATVTWLWKGPLAQSADSLQESGSSKAESYVLLVLLITVLAATVYMLVYVVG